MTTRSTCLLASLLLTFARPLALSAHQGVSAQEKEHINAMEKSYQGALGKMTEDERKEFEAVIKKCEAATVRVFAGSTTGSGVVVESGAYVVTGGHITKDVGGEGGELTLIFPDGRNVKARVVKHQFDTRLQKASSIDKAEAVGKIDIAIAKISNAGNDTLPSVELGNPEEGGFAMAVGYPRGHGKSKEGKVISVKGTKNGAIPMTIVGSISSIKKTFIGFESPDNLFFLPGNSGGPMFNKKGEFIGTVTNTDKKKGGWGTHADIIRKFLDEVRK